MTRPDNPFGMVAERARQRKVFGLPELKTRFEVDADAWAYMEGLILGNVADWQPTGLISALGSADDD